MSSCNFDDGKVTESAETVGKVSMLMDAVGSKSGRHGSAFAMTFSRPGLYLTEKIYSGKKDIHLAICESWGPFTSVRSEEWSV